MSLAALETQPALIDQVHDRLLAAVVDGTLAPGRRLTQDEIALMLGVSRQPVSHAIQMLRRRGLLIDAGKRGIAVAPIDAIRIRDLYQVRAALDGLAAELAAVRCKAGTAPKGELAGLNAALEAGDDAARRLNRSHGGIGPPVMVAMARFAHCVKSKFSPVRRAFRRASTSSRQRGWLPMAPSSLPAPVRMKA